MQAAINAAGNLLPRRPLRAPPIYAKVNPADAPVVSLALTSKTMPLDESAGRRLHAPRPEDLPARGRRPRYPERRTAARYPRQGQRLARSPAMASTSMICARPRQRQRQHAERQLRRPPRGRFAINANDQLPTPAEIHEHRHRLPQRRARAPLRRAPPSSTAPKTPTSPPGPTADARHHHERGAPAGRQRHRQSSTASKPCCPICSATLPSDVDLAVLSDRTDDHPRVRRRCPVRVRARRRAGGDGDIRVPRQHSRPPSFPSLSVPLSIVGTFGRHVSSGASASTTSPSWR